MHCSPVYMKLYTGAYIVVGSVNNLWGLVYVRLYMYMHICRPAKQRHHHLPCTHKIVLQVFESVSQVFESV